MTNHAAFERLVATGLDFSLETHDATAVDEHLATCPDCRAIAAGYQADATRLRAIAFVEPPDRVRAVVFGAATRPRPGGWTPMKLLLAAALLLAALAGTTVAVGTLLRLVAAPISPVQWSAVPSGAALVQDNGTLRLERVAASGDRLAAIRVWIQAVLRLSRVATGARGIGRPTAAPSAVPSSSMSSATRGGFTIVGSSSGRPTIWTSPDGSGWTATTLGDSAGELRSVVTHGGLAVSVGSQSSGGSAGRADLAGAAWHRADGGWELVMILGATAPGEMTELTWTGREFLAIDGSSVYGSTDGVVWRRVSTGLPGGATRLAADGGSILAAGLDGEAPAIWTSARRRGLERGAGSLRAREAGSRPVASRGGSLVAVGSSPSGVAAWYSTDGSTWLSGAPIEDSDGGLMLDLTWATTALSRSARSVRRRRSGAGGRPPVSAVARTCGPA